MKERFKKLIAKVIAKLVAKLDVNKDGKVTVNEVLTFLKPFIKDGIDKIK